MEFLYLSLIKMRIMMKYRHISGLQKVLDAHQEKKKPKKSSGRELTFREEEKKWEKNMLILPLKHKNSAAHAYFCLITMAETRCNSALGPANVSIFLESQLNCMRLLRDG